MIEDAEENPMESPYDLRNPDLVYLKGRACTKAQLNRNKKIQAYNIINHEI